MKVVLLAVISGLMSACFNPLVFPTRTYKTGAAITSFSFEAPEAIGLIDSVGRTVNVTVPNGTDRSALVASFSIIGSKAEVADRDQQSGITPNDFSNPLIYRVLASDGSSCDYTVTVYEEADAAAAGSYGLVTASRTSGVAPLYVNFSAEFDAPGQVARGFQVYEYSWHFGDSSCGSWGTNGSSKNTAKGGITAHVFETPGTYTVSLTVRDASGVIATESFAVEVLDPSSVYSGEKTVCVSDVASADFSGAPAGSLKVATDDLSTITKYATAGRRILFRRGSSWTVSGLSWPGSSGPVTLGAYGAGVGEDALGQYANAPQITVASGSFLDLSGKQDWRIMDLHLVDSTRTNGSVSGAYEMQRILCLRLKSEGFETGLGWSHWNTSSLMTIDQMAVVSCDISGSQSNIAFVGGERLAVMGNILKDPRDSHVLRVWQAYRSVISNNLVSGSSLDGTTGRHALKLHGPGYSTFQGVNEYGTPVKDTGLLANRTEFVVVSGNVFGASGPWPVAIGPQDSLTDARLSDVVFERNRIVSQYGSQSATPVEVGLHLWCSYSTVRNNILDGSGSGNDYFGIVIEQRGAEPAPTALEVLNNTIYRRDNAVGYNRVGVQVSSAAIGTVIKNNLVSFPASTVYTRLIDDSSGSSDVGGNLLVDNAGFLDPNNVDPLKRNFSLSAVSPAVDQGLTVAVLEDFAGTARTGTFDIGCYSR